MKIVLLGGSGNLGSEIIKLNPKINAPSSKEMDLSDFFSLKEYIKNKKPDIIINSAAITDTVRCEKDILSAIDVNTLGPINLIKIQENYSFKLVHISTDYVFDGAKGNYRSCDPINPISNYSKSKAAAELIVRMNPKNLVIRTSFFPLEFKHPAAFTDQYSTKDFVDIVAPMIYKESMSDKTGIVHVGTNRSSVYDKVKKRYPGIKKMSRKDITNVYIPKDTSLV